MGRSLWKGPYVDENLVQAVQLIAKREEQQQLVKSALPTSVKKGEQTSKKTSSDTQPLPASIQQIRVSTDGGRGSATRKQNATQTGAGGQLSTNLTQTSQAINRYKIRTWARNSTILADWVGKIFDVYNGKAFIPVLINAQMVGQKLGSYALTRKLPKHPSAKAGNKGTAGKK